MFLPLETFEQGKLQTFMNHNDIICMLFEKLIIQTPLQILSHLYNPL